jgi:hypothetical protein
MISHNEGHRIAIEAARNVVKSMGTYLDKDVIKKFAKSQIEKCQKYIKDADALAEGRTGEDKVWDDKYFRTDGIDCGYRTILEIVRKQVYFDKNPRMPEWSDVWWEWSATY